MATVPGFRIKKPSRRAQTCDLCKIRHQKCNGGRPACSNCVLRSVNCLYSGSARVDGADTEAPNSGLPYLTSSNINASTSLQRLAFSETEYSRLRDQLLDDILRRFSSPNGNVHQVRQDTTQESNGNKRLSSATEGASLHSFHQSISSIIKDCLDSRQKSTFLNGDPTGSSLTKIEQSLAMPTFQNARKVLHGSLPSKDASHHLLENFLNHLNSIFYTCDGNTAFEMLNQMYEKPEDVSIAWFCQMFLIFALGVQFDDTDDESAAIYYDVGRKYMDEALEENPEDNLWVMRAMLLICFYQPTKKWTTIWIFLDTAIRKAQRHQLDMNFNTLQDLTNEEYSDWRQIWLTVISFDRWAAIFLGRLPHIKEAISRDPIFKDIHYESGLKRCEMQTKITTMSIIAGNILRDVYFLGSCNVDSYQRYKLDLETWISDIPGSLRQQIESGAARESSPDLAEAIMNLHFMYFGSWILLTKPPLLHAARSVLNSKEGIAPDMPGSFLDAQTCLRFAALVINTSKSIPLDSLPPKRVIMPVFFLVYAAYTMLLGLLKDVLTTSNAEGSPGLARETSDKNAVLDIALQVLEVCGRGNFFARRYSNMIKELWKQLGRRMATAETQSTTSASTSPARASQLPSPETMPDMSSMFPGTSANRELGNEFVKEAAALSFRDQSATTASAAATTEEREQSTASSQTQYGSIDTTWPMFNGIINFEVDTAIFDASDTIDTFEYEFHGNA